MNLWSRPQVTLHIFNDNPQVPFVAGERMWTRSTLFGTLTEWYGLKPFSVCCRRLDFFLSTLAMAPNFRFGAWEYVSRPCRMSEWLCVSNSDQIPLPNYVQSPQQPENEDPMGWQWRQKHGKPIFAHGTKVIKLNNESSFHLFPASSGSCNRICRALCCTWRLPCSKSCRPKIISKSKISDGCSSSEQIYTDLTIYGSYMLNNRSYHTKLPRTSHEPYDNLEPNISCRALTTVVSKRSEAETLRMAMATKPPLLFGWWSTTIYDKILYKPYMNHKTYIYF